MTVIRTWIAGSSFFLCSSVLLAQTTAPISPGVEVKEPEGLTSRIPRAELNLSEFSFVVKPYVQLGHTPAPRTLALAWHSADIDAVWSVEFRPGIGRRWQAAQTPSFRRVAVTGVEPHRVYLAALTDLEPGGTSATA